jgi:RNA polymerase sigma-70 factor (ECF subfamily)
MRPVESSDSLTAARLAAGDELALAEVFDRLAPAVHATAMRLVDVGLAEDVVQDVFVDLWCHPERYDATLGSLRTYLCLRARHRALDVLRSELRRLARHERRERMMSAEPDREPIDGVLTAETIGAVREAMRTLPPEQMELVELAYFQGLSYRDAARAAGIPEGTAKSRLRLALTKLEKLLDRELLESS